MTNRTEGAATVRTRTGGRSSGRTRTGGRSLRSETTAGTATDGLTNARTRIVGTRTGPVADALVGGVRIGRAAARVASRTARRAAEIVTPLGWTMLVVAPATLAVGYGSGIDELIVIGWAVVVLLAIAALYLLGRSRFAVALDLPSSRVTVGDRAVGRIRVTNPLRRRVYGATAEVPVGAGLAEIALPGLGGGAAFEHEFGVPTVRRGIVPVGPVRTVRADPIGLLRRELEWTGVTQLFVHPRTITLPSTSTGFVRDLEGNPTRDLTSSDVSFHALREYAHGDERRFIHWKSTAKTGVHMVRQFEQTRRSHLVVALSLASTDYLTEEEFELAVSAAGSLGVRAIRDSRSVSVVVSETTPEFAARKVFAVRSLSTVTRTRLLDGLAGVEHTPAALAVGDVARVAASSVAGVSVAFLVCGSPVTAGRLRAAAHHFPLGVEVVAIVCDPESVPGLRRVAGFNVLTVGYLDDLQKALARSVAA